MDRSDRETFERDGVVVVRNILTSPEIEVLRASVDQQVQMVGQSDTGYDFEAISKAIWDGEEKVESGAASRFDLENLKNIILSDPFASPLYEQRQKALKQSGGAFFYDAAAWRRFPGVKIVALYSKLPAYCAYLLRSTYLNFWEDTTFVKTPGTRQRTAFHQDLGYFQIKGDQCVIVWIPLDPADQSNGVTEYVRGSHRWPETFASNTFISQTPLPTSNGPRLPDIEGNRDNYDIVSFDVNPGDVVICHVRTVHGAGGNLSDRPRRAMSFRYCGDEVRYHKRVGALSEIANGSALQDGDPLFSDDYPMAWPPCLRRVPPSELRAATRRLSIQEDWA